jgi:hypothetical protein
MPNSRSSSRDTSAIMTSMRRDDIDLLQDVPDILKLLACTKDYE